MKFEFGNGMGRRGGALGAAAVALALAVAPSAATAEASRRSAPKVELAAGAGSIVAVDAATGELRTPTSAEVQALTKPATMSRQSERSEVVTSADGTEMALLPESLSSVSVAWVNPDGTLSQTCVDGIDAAAMLTQLGGLGSAVEDR